MNDSRLFLVLLLSALTAATIQAQDRSSDEDLREINLELRDVEREREKLGDHIQDLDTRLKWLQKARRLRLSMLELEEQIARAFELEQSEKAERLEEQLEPLEIDLEEVFVQLEVLDFKRELGELRDELAESGMEEDAAVATSLLLRNREHAVTVKRLFDVYRNGPESQERELESKSEALGAEIDRKAEMLRLKLELHWAREDDNKPVIEELEDELRDLERMQDVDQIDTGDLPKPIDLTESEIANAAKRSLEGEILPLLKTLCFECHDESSASGELNLESLVAVEPLVIHRDAWVNVRQQIRVRSMPPTDAPQPSEQQQRTLVAWLTSAIDRFDYTTVRSPGYEPARRLTREEYNNTTRDLFGLDLRVADRFPGDMTASSGFENSANSLFIQPVHLERYLAAAELLVGQAMGGEAPTQAQREVRRRILAGGTPRSAVARFAARAFRRPLGSGELDRLLAHFDQLSVKSTPIDALAATLQIILVSPSFLIRSEQDGSAGPGEVFAVSDDELATRLSYFLWASMPDDELFRHGRAGRLHERATLRQQVDRMLDDPKAESLGDIFAAQWLRFCDLNRVPRDQIDNPWATDSLIEAMRQESAMLFHAMIRENLPIEQLVDADYTYVNEELARHYRIPGVRGDQMRRISLQRNPRRGILGHGSILAVTSFPNRHSPVLRGNWILTHLLGTPPPPPPPNVSEFDERLADNENLTQRQKIEIHRKTANCYACHSQIDPLGFAMEHYDWFGRHRPTHRGKRIDATGQLPSGREATGLAGLSDAIVEERADDLVLQATRKMLSYALGRQLEYYDEATVREIADQWTADGRRVRSLVHAIVQCESFLRKQVPPFVNQSPFINRVPE